MHRDERSRVHELHGDRQLHVGVVHDYHRSDVRELRRTRADLAAMWDINHRFWKSRAVQTESDPAAPLRCAAA